MALADLVPTSPLVTLEQSCAQVIPFVTKDSTGANIDITGWFGFALKVFPSSGVAAAAPLLSLTPTPTAGSGSAKVTVSAANSASIPPGTYVYSLIGKVLTGDDNQLVARGTLIVNNNT